MPDTMGSTHQTGPSLHDGQHAVFGTGLHATATPNAVVDIDLRVLGQRLVGTLLFSFPYLLDKARVLGGMDRPVPHPKYRKNST